MEQFVARLEELGLGLGDEDIADVLWLAMQMGVTSTPSESVQETDVPTDGATTASASSGQNESVIMESTTSSTSVDTLDEPVEREEEFLSPFSVFVEESVIQPPDETAQTGEVPLQAPASTALPNALELGRSLRPLMRKVPSTTHSLMDVDATVNRIIEQDNWQPILRPAPERWLDLELVVESLSVKFVWEAVIRDFTSKVLDRQGAFRSIRVWTLANENGQPVLMAQSAGEGNKRLGHPRELVHPSGRRLIMVLSDMRSPLWYEMTADISLLDGGTDSDVAATPNIYDWLEYWAKKGPVALVQLLPEWLWEQSALGFGINAYLGSVTPGEANQLWELQGLTARQRRLVGGDNALKIPVVTLDCDSLYEWARAVAGMGPSRTAGVVFNMARLPQLQQRHQDEVEQNEDDSPDVLVDRFLGTASFTAQRLASMMASVPVSLSVVRLIQSELLRDATPVHVAEVFMSDLLSVVGENQRTQQPIYEFRSREIRQLLIQSFPTYTTHQVITALSEALSRKLKDPSINSFAAFLTPESSWLDQGNDEERIVSRFATLLPDVLRTMGGAYALLADSAVVLEQTKKVLNRSSSLTIDGDVSTDQEETDSTAQNSLEALMAGLSSRLIEDDIVPRIVELPAEPIEVPITVVMVLTTPASSLPSMMVGMEVEQKSVTTLRFVVGGETGEIAESIKLPTFLFRVAQVVQKEPGVWGRLRGREATWVIDYRQAEVQRDIAILPGSVELEVVAIPPGRFMMGSPQNEPESNKDERPRHEVTIAYDFLMGRYPVTQAQWRAVAAFPQVERELNPNPSNFKGDNRPVEQVSWYDAVEFCRRLNAYFDQQFSEPQKYGYRLPSEAEWEYACRAGTSTPFHFGSMITTDVANYNGDLTYNEGPKGRSLGQTNAVTAFDHANAFGLSDMHGNVWEWCLDPWHENHEGAPTDGSAWQENPSRSNRRVARGGSWDSVPWGCRSACRGHDDPDDQADALGFRVVLAPRSAPLSR